tara:strand:- start:15905 stop:16090 length:186 start_codon:yes stop_codon:yes gene_type:complete
LGKQKPKKKNNVTDDGGLACAYGTPWLDHFAPPSGTGKGCESCDALNRQFDEQLKDNPTIH